MLTPLHSRAQEKALEDRNKQFTLLRSQFKKKITPLEERIAELTAQLTEKVGGYQEPIGC